MGLVARVRYDMRMNENPYDSPTTHGAPLRSYPQPRLNGFDKFCAVIAFPLGVIFLILGALGVVLGCSAHFTLPPPLGILPAFAGWGIVRAIRIAWKASNRPDAAGSVYFD
jgi:hypothetical protein